MSELIRHPVHRALTRPQMFAGVTYNFFILNFALTTELFLITGSFWALLNPFALLCGVVSLSLLALQGATFLAHRTEGELQARARGAGTVLAVLLLAAFSAAGVWVGRLDGFVIQSIADVGGALNPLMKEVVRQPGAWFANYQKYPLLWPSSAPPWPAWR